jgi:hypothetical protein
VKLYSRPGNDLTDRFPLIVEAHAKLRPRSCLIDGEAVTCGDDGIASFDRIRYRHHDASVFLYTFDLIELDGDDLRRDPLAVRKATLASLLAHSAPGLRFNEHMDEKDVRARAQARARRHRVEAPQLPLSLRALAGLDQEQEPSGTGGETGSRRGLGAVTLEAFDLCRPTVAHDLLGTRFHRLRRGFFVHDARHPFAGNLQETFP